MAKKAKPGKKSFAKVKNRKPAKRPKRRQAKLPPVPVAQVPGKSGEEILENPSKRGFFSRLFSGKKQEETGKGNEGRDFRAYEKKGIGEINAAIADLDREIKKLRKRV